MNEALADIFGTLIEFDAKGDGGNWLIGESSPGFSIASPLRSLADPHMKDLNGRSMFDRTKRFSLANRGQPDHYSEVLTPDDELCGSTAYQDNGCVHFNSGILNKFRLSHLRGRNAPRRIRDGHWTAEARAPHLSNNDGGAQPKLGSARGRRGVRRGLLRAGRQSRGGLHGVRLYAGDGLATGRGIGGAFDMRAIDTMDRRTLLTRMVAAVLAAPLAGRLSIAEAAEPSIWRSLSDLASEAQRLGLAVPRMSAAPSAQGDTYGETLPAIVDFMDNVQASAADASGVTSADVDAILEKASDLLRTARQAERVPRDIGGTPGAKPLVIPSFDSIAEDYRKLFSSCKIRDDKRSEVQWYTSKITDPTRRKLYDQVSDETCVPWYFVAIIHGMECGFDVKAHLHNGDPLKAKTVQVPANRRPCGTRRRTGCRRLSMPSVMTSSTKRLTGISRRSSIAGGLQRLAEPRALLNHTPYLWSFSNHYSKGKFVADGVWDANAVSKQCGAAVMLKMLSETGAVGTLT